MGPIETEIQRGLGKRIKRARQASSLSQTSLARRAGVHRNTLMRWEKGLMAISLLDFLKIVDSLAIDRTALLPSASAVELLREANK